MEVLEEIDIIKMWRTGGDAFQNVKELSDKVRKTFAVIKSKCI